MQWKIFSPFRFHKHLFVQILAGGTPSMAEILQCALWCGAPRAPLGAGVRRTIDHFGVHQRINLKSKSRAGCGNSFRSALADSQNSRSRAHLWKDQL
jgi:hypothetical protein